MLHSTLSMLLCMGLYGSIRCACVCLHVQYVCEQEFVCACIGVSMPWCACKDQRTPLDISFHLPPWGEMLSLLDELACRLSSPLPPIHWQERCDHRLSCCGFGWESAFRFLYLCGKCFYPLRYFPSEACWCFNYHSLHEIGHGMFFFSLCSNMMLNILDLECGLKIFSLYDKLIRLWISFD